MNLLASLQWILKCVFTCNHGRTETAEGKCFCPDCGRGVIFQWVVIRCESCRHRTDSRIALRQLVPERRCCANCGEQSFVYDYLESPSYFQLHRARLIVREESEYLQGRCQWSAFAHAEQWPGFPGQALNQAWDRFVRKTLALLPISPGYAPALIPVHCQTANQTTPTRTPLS